MISCNSYFYNIDFKYNKHNYNNINEIIQYNGK